MTVDAALSATTFATAPRRSFDTGSEAGFPVPLPGPAEFTQAEARNSLNPLQYVPVVGTIYRLVSGEAIPPPLAIAGSVVSGALTGGPLGVLGTVLFSLGAELARLGPDTSRPATPEGMDQTGSEAGIRPVSPGSDPVPGGYLTLATTLPDWLGGIAPGRAVAAYEAGSAIGYG